VLAKAQVVRIARASMNTVALKSSEKSAVSRLFSSSVFRELATKGRSALFTRLLHQSGLFGTVRPNESVGDAFETAFAVLRNGSHRDEYIYRAALTHRILLGTHSLKTACMLNEFRVGECKADVAILNGTGTVYEIKSERDSLSRLEKQIETYKKVFARVFVIAGENHVDAVRRSVCKDVGVLCLSSRHQISTLQDAVTRADRVCPTTVFDSVRTSEAKMILQDLALPIPEAPNTAIRYELRKRFEVLSPVDVHSAMVRTLKVTRNLMPLASLVESLPPSLKAAALSIPLKKRDHRTLVGSINTKLKDAMEWA
jgi:hypothetical protein